MSRATLAPGNGSALGRQTTSTGDRPMFRRTCFSATLLLALAAPALGAALDPPTISLVSADRASITLEVQAGASGAPFGLVVEWMTLTDYRAAGGWPASDAVHASDCTGAPTLNVTPGVSSFRLAPGEAALVVLGAFFDETGVSTVERQELEDGTSYVVRARAAAGLGYDESANSATVPCATPPRTSTDCTVTVGYWKSHPESWSRVASVTLGTVPYTRTQLLDILGQPARGNGLVSLAHQLIAAKLNFLLGALPTPAVGDAVTQADALIGPRVVPPVGGGWLAPGDTNGLTSILDGFNSGTLGPGHCPDSLQVLPAKVETWGRVKTHYR